MSTDTVTSPASPLDRFIAVIPAGGVGTRLWPLSRAAAPKFLHDLTGSGSTLLRATYDRPRAAPTVPADLRAQLIEWFAPSVERLVADGWIEPDVWPEFA